MSSPSHLSGLGGHLACIQSEWLTEEPDVWEIRLSGSERGRGTTEGMAEIKWHRRETRRQTEKTNLDLQLWK